MKHTIALFMTLLMLTLPFAAADPNQPPPEDPPPHGDSPPPEDSPHIQPGAHIDYTKETLVIERDDQNKTVRLNIGEAHMAVLYFDGTIALFTEQTRYLGVADLHDESGKHQRRGGIPVKSILHQRLLGTIEYVDSNENGLLDLNTATAAASFTEVMNSRTDNEEIIKWLDYRDISWVMTDWNLEREDNNATIEFTLRAENVAYQGPQSGSEVVEQVEYIFKVQTRGEEINVDAVPHYRIDYHGDAEEPTIDDSTLLARSDVTGQVLNATWKYDQHISGWDLAGNQDNHRLFTLTSINMGTYFEERVSNWMAHEFKDTPQLKAKAGKAKHHRNSNDIAQHDKQGNPLQCKVDYAANHDVNVKKFKDTKCREIDAQLIPDDENFTKPEIIRAGALRFDDGDVNLGRIRWASNATVDGNETEVLFQIHGVKPGYSAGVPFHPDGRFIGVHLIGGYNIVAGEDSYHDPEFGTDMLTLSTQSFGEPIDESSSKNGMPLRILGISSAILVVVVTVATVGNRRREAPVPGSEYAAVGGWTQTDDDWEAYRNP